MEADAIAEDYVGIGAPAHERRLSLDLPELSQDPLVHGATHAQQCERSLSRHEVGEEELQQALVADVDAEVGLGQPVLETATPVVGQAVDGPCTSAARSSLTLDEPRCREPA